jgi:hypothetical protein
MLHATSMMQAHQRLSHITDSMLHAAATDKSEYTDGIAGSWRWERG